jgi:elongation factor 1 alpha-like protein
MINGKQVPFAAAGDNVDLLLGGLEHNEAAVASLRPGSILCWPSHPIRMISKFKAQIATFPSLDMPIVPGQQLMFHAHTLEEPCNITKLLRTLDREGHTKQIKPRSLGKNTVAVVRVSLTRPVCAETFAEHKRLGRFMLRYGGQTVAAGMVQKIKR